MVLISLRARMLCAVFWVVVVVVGSAIWGLSIAGSALGGGVFRGGAYVVVVRLGRFGVVEVISLSPLAATNTSTEEFAVYAHPAPPWGAGTPYISATYSLCLSSVLYMKLGQIHSYTMGVGAHASIICAYCGF